MNFKRKTMPEVKVKPRTDSFSPSNARALSAGSNCLVAKGTKIEGNFHSAENLRLDGEIVGEVKCDQKLVMGQESRIQGKVLTAEAVIMGVVKGDIKVSGVLHLKPTARIEGNIASKYMVVEEGAQFNGECKIGS